MAKKKDNVEWVDISAEMGSVDGWRDGNHRNGYNFIELFAGAGGLSCGLVMAGFNPLYAVEHNEHAVRTYNRNFKENHEPFDIRDKDKCMELINSVADKEVHLISGGFPCQGFSLAGRRVVTDERNSLYLDMLGIVKEIKPDYVLMENVEGLRSMLGGGVEQKILSDYADAGYKVDVTVLNSADYGVAQTRRRVIFIGNRLNKRNLFPLPILTPDKYKRVQDEIMRFMSIPEDESTNHIFTAHAGNIRNKLKTLQEGESLYPSYSDAWKRVFWDKPCMTVKECHGGVFVHPKRPRVMTPRELAALQSFPDDFIFEGPKKWQLVQIGNAVPPLLGKAVGLAVQKSLEE